MYLQTTKVDKQLFIGQQPVAPRTNPMISDAVHYHAPENRDIKMPIPESVTSSSFSSLPVSHPPIRAVSSVPQVDGATSQKKAFHLRPPHPAPSNQFSYVQADQLLQTRMEIPPQAYPSRFHFMQNTDRGNFYSDRDRIETAPHDVGERWRFSAPPLSGKKEEH